MAIGTYGTIRPADVNIGDIDIYYNYTPNRETRNDDMFKLNTNDVLSDIKLPSSEQDIPQSYSEKLLEGLYNLKLPSSIFNKLGIYTIYIVPKKFYITITDCGVLSSLPNIRGLVVNLNSLPSGLRANNALQGYRIEYIDVNNGNKIRNMVRYIVTSNRVVPVNDNVGGTTQKATRYKFDDTGTLMFLQITPSSSSNIKPNMSPSIGVANQTIIISNTFFTPITLEVEMVSNTIDTLSDLIGGEQIKDVDNGILTYYDSNRQITRQFDIYQIKDDVNNVPLFEVKERRTVIDETQDFNSVTDGVL